MFGSGRRDLAIPQAGRVRPLSLRCCRSRPVNGMIFHSPRRSFTGPVLNLCCYCDSPNGRTERPTWKKKMGELWKEQQRFKTGRKLHPRQFVGGVRCFISLFVEFFFFFFFGPPSRIDPTARRDGQGGLLVKRIGSSARGAANHQLRQVLGRPSLL